MQLERQLMGDESLEPEVSFALLEMLRVRSKLASCAAPVRGTGDAHDTACKVVCLQRRTSATCMLLLSRRSALSWKLAHLQCFPVGKCCLRGLTRTAACSLGRRPAPPRGAAPGT